MEARTHRTGDQPPVHVRAQRFFYRQAWAFDALFIALPLTLVELFVAVSLYTGPYPAGVEYPLHGVPADLVNALRVAVVLAMCTVLALRRVWPIAIAWTVTGLALASIILGASPDFHYLAVPITVYTVTAYAARRWSVVFSGLGYLGALLVGAWFTVSAWSSLTAPDGSDDRTMAVLMIAVIVVLCAAIVTVAWLLGDLRRRTRAQSAALAERAALLERERDHEARLAADAERLRIARELHDVVSHSMSVMIAQADGGRFIAGQAPENVSEVFTTIGQTGRTALAEMRRMLGVLREPDAEAARAPMPDVADLPSLVADVRASGLRVDLIGDVDSIPPLPPGAGLAVYRTVQEALTNTLKHAGAGSHATVRVQYGRVDRSIFVRIDDTGAGIDTGADADHETPAPLPRTTRYSAPRPEPRQAEVHGPEPTDDENRDEQSHSSEVDGAAIAGAASPIPSGDGHGSGLAGMRERAALYGGTVETSRDDSGFHVLLIMPLSDSLGTP